LTASVRQTWLVSCLLAVAALIVFSPALTCGFVNFDDPAYVTANPHVRSGLSWSGVRWAATTTDAANWHPVTWLSHMMDCQLYDLRPAGHHLTSLVFHAANAVLLLLLLRRMTGALWPSAWVAALFALHPLRVESVVWISERKDVQSAFFGLLAMLSYVRYAENLKSQVSNFKFDYGETLVLFALALLAKPMLVTLPFVFLLLDFWPLRRFPPRPRLIWEKIPFLVLTIGSCGMTFLAQQRGGAAITTAQFPFIKRLETIPLAYVDYLSKNILPVNLSSFYGHGEIHMVAVIATALLLTAVTALVIWRRRPQPYLAVGWFWFLGMLVPVIGLLQVGGQMIADRYTYLPCIGLWIMLAWAIQELPATQPPLRKAAIAVLLASLAIFAALTWRHAGVYKSGETLWKATLRVDPDSQISQDNLSKWLIENGRLTEARQQALAALSHWPDDPAAANCLARISVREGKTDDAISYLVKYLALRPRDAEACDMLAHAWLKKGNADAAIAAFKKTVEINPGFSEAWCNLGFALVQERRLPDAIAAYHKALELDPHYALAHNDLGSILRQSGQTNEALEHFRQAVQARPAFAEAHYNLAEILLQQGHTNDALAEYRKALESLPNFAPAQARVAEILRRGKGNSAP
jgi:tetratricopeptide (TPR) repeat protein